MVDPLDQLPLRADRIKRLQQQRPQQPLRRDPDAPKPRIELFKLTGQRSERRIGNHPNHPQRMVRPDPLLKVYVAEKAAANRIVAAHRHPPSPTQGITMHNFRNPFSAPC
jgi:hypothetical protein